MPLDREAWRDIRVLGFWRWFYCANIYRLHMRMLHFFGRHGWKKVGPLMPYMPGQSNTFMRCDWCGARKETPDAG